MKAGDFLRFIDKKVKIKHNSFKKEEIFIFEKITSENTIEAKEVETNITFGLDIDNIESIEPLEKLDKNDNNFEVDNYYLSFFDYDKGYEFKFTKEMCIQFGNLIPIPAKLEAILNNIYSKKEILIAIGIDGEYGKFQIKIQDNPSKLNFTCKNINFDMKDKSELSKEIIKCDDGFRLIYNTIDDNFYIQFPRFVTFPPTEISFLKITHTEALIIISSENPCGMLEKIYYKYCAVRNYEG